MKIYNLKDEELSDVDFDVDSTKGVDTASAKQLQITDIRQAVKNENRVNIFVNDKYSFSLDVAQVIEFKIKIGSLISEEQLAEYKRAGEFGKYYQRALEWVLMRPRSKKELQDYLTRSDYRFEAKAKKKEWEIEREIADSVAKGEDVQRLLKQKKRHQERPKYDFRELIAERLIERGYVDDEKFAEYYVENRFVKKGISKRRLKMELTKKGVSSDIIEKVLDHRSDEEEILKMIAKKRAKYDDEKLISYLCRQGFDYQLVQNLVLNYGKD